MSPGGKNPKAQHQELRAGTVERLEAIVEAAERAAAGVIDDAEAQARSYLAQARAEADQVTAARVSELGDLVEALLRQASALCSEAERLQAALESARERINPEQRDAALEAEDSTAQAEILTLRNLPAEAEPQDEDRSSSASGARLLATQMAVSGSSRKEIEERLRNRFEIEDPGAVLDAILGPED